MRKIILIISLVISYSIYGQDSKTNKDINDLWGQVNDSFQSGKYTNSIKYLKKIDTIAIKNNLFSNQISANIYLAMTYSLVGDNEKVKVHLDLAFNVGENNNSFPDSTYEYSTWCYLNGLSFITESKFELAFNFFKKTKTLLEREIDFALPTSDLHSNLGLCYSKFGDSKRAIEFYQYVINQSTTFLQKAKVYQNIGEEFSELGNLKVAKDYFHKSLNHLEDPYSSSNLRTTILNNLAHAHIRLENYDSALFILNQVKDLKSSKLNQAKTTQELGNAYLGLGDYQKADSLLKKALQMRFEVFGNRHQQVASTLRQIGDAYAQQKKHQEALNYYQRAFTHLSLDFSDSTNYTKNPPLQNINSRVYLLKTLRHKAESQQAINQNKDALNTLQTADNLLDSMRIHYLVADGSKYFCLEKAKEIYEQAIPLALSLNKPETAFYFSQKSHGLLLREGIKELKTKATTLPDSLIESERQMKIEIANLESKLFQRNITGKNKIESNLFDARYKLEQFRKSLKQNFPKYYQQKYQLPFTNIATIQQNLTESNQALIEYFIGEKELFYFVITKNDFNVYSKQKPAKFSEWINNTRETLASNDSSLPAFKRYTESAYNLYKLLFEEINQNFPKLSEFIIISDETLGYLPFSVFLPENTENFQHPKYNLLPYLGKEFCFSYNYSSALFVELNQPKARDILAPFVGYAPSFPGHPISIRNGEKLDSLIYNRKEIRRIDSIVHGIIFTDTTATLQNFLNNTIHHKILHLATHATANDLHPNQSKIHFFDKAIHTHELYNLDLNTELTVLSACETGTGQLQKGEGIMSLARGFMYSGCPSIVTSLWKVNDKKTGEIMYDFYKKLDKGLSTNKALHEAQKTYLQKANSSSQAHPYYWANFVQIGNTSPIFENPEPSFPFSLWEIILRVGLLFGVFLFFQKRRNRS